MSDLNKNVISVRDLIVGVKGYENAEQEFRFLIDYGSFDIRFGDFVLLKGRNGSGKSTFLRLFHLQGFDYFKVVSGSICFHDGAFPKDSIHTYTAEQLTHLNCVISFIGQEERFLTSDSAYSYIYNVCDVALAYDRVLSKAQRREKLLQVDGLIQEYYQNYLAASFQCKEYKTFKNKNIRAWSGGQQKMISVLAGIIKAKICGLKLVIMDEPLNNLDGKNKDVLNKLIAELRKNDVAIIVVTHCQIFDGINKVLTLAEQEDGVQKATLLERNEPAHTECLENFH